MSGRHLSFIFLANQHQLPILGYGVCVNLGGTRGPTRKARHLLFLTLGDTVQAPTQTWSTRDPHLVL